MAWLTSSDMIFVVGIVEETQDQLKSVTLHEARESGSSVIECRTRNRGSPGSNPALVPLHDAGESRGSS